MRTIGVLGGMGPAAAADFYGRVVAHHGAPRDQDHPPCIMYSATQVPDRTAFLLAGGADPAPQLAAAAAVLEAAGADFIAMPCNSAHAFLSAVRAAVSVPVVDMIALTAAAVARMVPPVRNVGVLATNGTVDVGLYDEPLAARDFAPLYPPPAMQAEVMAAIKDVKGGALPPAGTSDPRLVAAAQHLSEAQADCIILGCTELPLALRQHDSPVVSIDGNQILAETTLALATERLAFAEVADAVR